MGLNPLVPWRISPPLLTAPSRCARFEDYVEFRKTISNWVWLPGNSQKPVNVERTLKKLCDLPDQPYSCPDMICVDWSDMFYIPERLFEDFVTLSDIFYQERVFLEIAVPMMLELLTRYKKVDEYHAMETVRCFGGCCVEGNLDNVHQYRCGHRLDHQRVDLVEAHFGNLKEWAKGMGL